MGDVVLKIVPLLSEVGTADYAEASSSAAWPAVTDAEDVLREVNATRVMGGVHPGFTKLLG